MVGGEELSDAERDQLLELCRQRLDAFRMQRGEEVFAHRSRHRTPISGSIKVRVLTWAKGRCECCGAGCCLANPAPGSPGGGLHRAQEPGRADDLSNLQSLCFRCNAGKRWEARGGLWVLRAGGQRPGAAGERTGALYRRCLPGDTWSQPGEPAAACGGWVGVAPAGMERGGGAAEEAAGAAERPGCVDQRLG